MKIKENKLEIIEHSLEPLINEKTRILILGSFPSVKSREVNFYYGNKLNRFWMIMEALFYVELKDIESKKRFLDEHHIGLYDACYSCLIKGSSDASLIVKEYSNISKLCQNSQIEHVFLNGKKAYEIYLKSPYKLEGVDYHLLPSSSPLNASYKLKELIEAYKLIKDCLD